MKKYKYLLWDVDGTILDFEIAEEIAIKHLFHQFNLGECTDEMLKRYSKINRRYWEALEREEMTKDAILVGRFQEFFETEGLDSNIAADFNEAYQLALGDTIVVCDDAIDIIKEQMKDYEVAIITNGTAVAQEKKLRKSGLDKMIEYVFISEEVGYEKPSLKFFDRVISDMNIADVSKALIIGDSLTSDIKGGCNIGIDTCWYNPKELENHTSIVPTYTIKNLHELDFIL